MARILTLNSGSSSVKLGAFEAHAGTLRRLEARRVDREAGAADAALLTDFARATGGEPALVVHRFVHGGALDRTSRIDSAVRALLEAARPLAPLHLPRALAWLDAATRAFPTAAEVATFDTAFFRDLPVEAATYALPRERMRAAGIRRYGFHGLAHQAMWRGLVARRPELADARAITFQLGSGCSAAALVGGRPVDTSMGFSPLEGLVMATRPGDLDAGVLLHLLRGGLDVAGLERMLDEESGLKGLAGTGDLRQLLGRRDTAARLAIDVYCHRARKYLGAYLAVLGGAEAIVFGGGVGEHAAVIRARICAEMAFAGLTLDDHENAALAPGRISAPESKIEAWVIPVDEETALAEEGLPLV